jgi:hypothetical protein
MLICRHVGARACGRAVTGQRERYIHATLSPSFSRRERKRQGERERERARKRGKKREREGEREGGRGREREGERERIFKAMTGALAPFSY